jgi:hypothetical protein
MFKIANRSLQIATTITYKAVFCIKPVTKKPEAHTAWRTFQGANMSSFSETVSVKHVHTVGNSCI